MSNVNTEVSIAGVTLKNPVTVASGTFGSGQEFSEFVDLNKLGAVTTKGVAVVPWAGNPTPRVAETPSGMLNAIGLQNPGIDTFLKRDVPFLRKFDTKIIVNVCGHSEDEYVECVKRLADADVDLLEINISCPNVKAGGITFGTTCFQSLQWLPPPIILDMLQYPLSFTEIAAERIILDPPIPPGIDSTRIICGIPEPNIDISIRLTSIPGMHCHASITLCRYRSKRPPMTAEEAPSTTEIAVVSTVHVSPMITDVRAPYSM